MQFWAKIIFLRKNYVTFLRNLLPPKRPIANFVPTCNFFIKSFYLMHPVIPRQINSLTLLAASFSTQHNCQKKWWLFRFGATTNHRRPWIRWDRKTKSPERRIGGRRLRQVEVARVSKLVRTGFGLDDVTGPEKQRRVSVESFPAQATEDLQLGHPGLVGRRCQRRRQKRRTWSGWSQRQPNQVWEGCRPGRQLGHVTCSQCQS